MSSDPLSWLPAELHTLVARRSASVFDVLRSRLASPLLRGPAARAVRRLRAEHGHLPAEAWEVFSDATGVVVQLDELDGRWEAHLPHLDSSLPGRLEALEFSIAWRVPQHAAVGAFLQRLLDHPCAQRLKHLDASQASLAPGITRALLAHLPSLERCSLTVGAPVRQGEQTAITGTVVRIDAFPAQLQQLSLRNWSSEIKVDAAGLAACSGLTSLELALGEAQLDSTAAIMSACRQLHSLQLPLISIGPEQWKQLALGLPRLEELVVLCLELLPSSPPAPGLTSLSATMGLGAGAGAAEADAWRIGAHLPALQKLEVSYSSELPSAASGLLRALHDHPALAELCMIGDRVPVFAAWPQPGVLTSIPHLRKLEVEDCGCLDLDVVLEHAAMCPQLEELSALLVPDVVPRVAVGAAGLAALAAAGACRGSLRRLVLDTVLTDFMLSADDDGFLPYVPDVAGCLSIANAAQLLLPGVLPELRWLQLDVALPRAAEGCKRLQLDDASLLQLVEGELQALGMDVPAGSFKVDESPVPHCAQTKLRLPAGRALWADVGECRVRLIVWLSAADRRANGLVADSTEEDALWQQPG